MLRSRGLLMAALAATVLGWNASVRADEAQGQGATDAEGLLLHAAQEPGAEQPGVQAAAPQEEQADPARRMADLRKRIAVLAAMARVARNEQLPEVADALEQRAKDLAGELRDAIVALGQKGAEQKKELRASAEQLRARAAQQQDQARELEANGKADEALAARREAAKLMAQAIALDGRAAELGGWAEVALSLRQLNEGQAALRNEVQQMRGELDALKERVGAMER